MRPAAKDPPRPPLHTPPPHSCPPRRLAHASAVGGTCSRETGASTEPSRWRKPRTSTASPARCTGSAPSREPNTVKSRVVSRHVGTLAAAAAAAALRASSAMARSLRAGSSSSQGSSVSETRMVSPRPSCQARPPSPSDPDRRPRPQASQRPAAAACYGKDRCAVRDGGVAAVPLNALAQQAGSPYSCTRKVEEAPAGASRCRWRTSSVRPRPPPPAAPLRHHRSGGVRPRRGWGGFGNDTRSLRRHAPTSTLSPPPSPGSSRSSLLSRNSDKSAAQRLKSQVP